MNIYDSILLIKSKLEDGKDNPDDLLFGVNIMLDPYSELSSSLPLVLIEAERTEFNNSACGAIVSQEHLISLSCIVSAQASEYRVFKPAVNNLAERVINKLSRVDDYKIQKITPLEQVHSEIMIGALKCTAVIISINVQVYWGDN